MKSSTTYTILSDKGEVSHVCYLKRSKAIACCYNLNGNFVGLLDDQEVDGIVSYALDANERPLSMTSYFCGKNEEELFCVGTAIYNRQEPNRVRQFFSINK